MNTSDSEAARQFPAATIRRRIEWVHTDGAGIYHWSTVPLLMEAAETELLVSYGVAERLYGRIPRANVQIDYRAPLRFNDVVDIHVAITALGRTSLSYRFELRDDSVVAAEAFLTIVYVDAAGRPMPWPGDIRRRLDGTGPLSKFT